MPAIMLLELSSTPPAMRSSGHLSLGRECLNENDFSRQSHKFSIALKSSDFAGRCILSMTSFSRSSSLRFARCGQAFSYTNKNSDPNRSLNNL
ncbi:hypothetical protein NPIL_481031 [Nephila pilipes]|uniref:Uncharacterized protein n=1 Tax=Nephila pilipes TaxID=299642 RepID=A0A8X6PCJ6_NEPPI|nr:hypothetical protein NPIL_481031 [Nephila pilipes]